MTVSRPSPVYFSRIAPIPSLPRRGWSEAPKFGAARNQSLFPKFYRWRFRREMGKPLEILPYETYDGRAFQVGTDRWALVPDDQPVVTDTLYFCRALVVSDGEQKLFVHFLPNTLQVKILKILLEAENRGLDLRNADWAVIHGKYWEQSRLTLEKNIRDAARCLVPGKEREIRWLEPGEPGHDDYQFCSMAKGTFRRAGVIGPDRSAYAQTEINPVKG